jgi:hypothetical protein
MGQAVRSVAAGNWQNYHHGIVRSDSLAFTATLLRTTYGVRCRVLYYSYYVVLTTCTLVPQLRSTSTPGRCQPCAPYSFQATLHMAAHSCHPSSTPTRHRVTWQIDVGTVLSSDSLVILLRPHQDLGQHLPHPSSEKQRKTHYCRSMELMHTFSFPPVDVVSGTIPITLRHSAFYAAATCDSPSSTSPPWTLRPNHSRHGLHNYQQSTALVKGQ